MHILHKLGITKNPLKSVGFSSVIHYFARVVELVDTMDLKSVVRKDVPVRVRPRVLDEKPHLPWGFLLYIQFLSFGILWHIMEYAGVT